MEDANATQMESDLAILQRLREKNPEKLSYYKETAQAFEFEEQVDQQTEEYKKAGGDTGAIKRDLSALVPPAVGYSVAAPVATAVTPTIPVAPTVTPTKVLPNALNVGKNLLRVTPASIMGGETLTALGTGRYEKDKNLPEQGIFGDGYDSRKHGMYLEFPGIDVGRIPYYFNRSMHDMVINPIRSAFTPDPVDPDFEIGGADNGVTMPEPPESTRSEKPVPMPDITELLQSGIY